jgi:hypothetical protein
MSSLSLALGSNSNVAVIDLLSHPTDYYLGLDL